MSPRPLVVRSGALGDMVILTTVIRHLHARFGQPVDIVASASWTRDLLGDQPGVGNIFVIGSRKRPFWLSLDQRHLVQALRVRGAGPTWLCDQENHKICRLLVRAGWSSQHWCHYEDPPRLSGPHFCDRWLHFAYRSPPLLGGGDLPLQATDAYGELIVTPAQRANVDQWMQARGLADRGLILIQVGNKRTMRRGSRQRSSNSKYWPEENWAVVLSGLCNLHPECAILLLGVPQESAQNESILRLASVANAHNVVHELSLPRLIGLAARAVGMVSVDTGPAHLAAAVGCTVVTLFGKAEPSLYAPRGRSAVVESLVGERNGERSMVYITPAEVLSAWRLAIRA